MRLAGGDASSDSYCFPDVSCADVGRWLTLAVLGAYHGLNPAMGWLFAVVARACRSAAARGVLRSLVPIAIGHEASIVLVARRRARAGARSSTRRRCTSARRRSLIAFGIFRFVKPRAHFRWTTMRVNRPRARRCGRS